MVTKQVLTGTPVAANAAYVFRNPDPERRRLRFRFQLSAEQAIYDGLSQRPTPIAQRQAERNLHGLRIRPPRRSIQIPRHRILEVQPSKCPPISATSIFPATRSPPAPNAKRFQIAISMLRKLQPGPLAAAASEVSIATVASYLRLVTGAIQATGRIRWREAFSTPRHIIGAVGPNGEPPIR